MAIEERADRERHDAGRSKDAQAIVEREAMRTREGGRHGDGIRRREEDHRIAHDGLGAGPVVAHILIGKKIDAVQIEPLARKVGCCDEAGGRGRNGSDAGSAA